MPIHNFGGGSGILLIVGMTTIETNTTLYFSLIFVCVVSAFFDLVDHEPPLGIPKSFCLHWSSCYLHLMFGCIEDYYVACYGDIYWFMIMLSLFVCVILAILKHALGFTYSSNLIKYPFKQFALSIAYHSLICWPVISAHIIKYCFLNATSPFIFWATNIALNTFIKSLKFMQMFFVTVFLGHLVYCLIDDYRKSLIWDFLSFTP